MKILNIDTLEFGIDVLNYEKVFANFLEELSKRKIRAQENYEEEIFNIGGINFIVKPKGMSFYSYGLECNDFYIYFSSKVMKNNSPIFIKFLSSFLWKNQFKKAFDLFMKWFMKFDCEMIGTRISRLDICFDTDEISFVPEDKDRFVSRARKLDLQFPDSEHYIGKKFSGFVIGKGSPLLCRIYDKTLEIVSSSKNWFKEIWKENGWNEENEVWRVEFQIRRKILKEFNILTFQDVISNIDTMWAYLTQNWLLMKDKTTDKNVTRSKIMDKWEIVQKGNCGYKATQRIREVIKRGDLEKLYRLCSGAMISIGALKGLESLGEVYLEVAEFTRKNNKKKGTTFGAEVAKRRNRFVN